MTPSRRSAPKVLVVDDDPSMLRATARTLSQAGFDVSTADGPFGVTNLVARNEPAAVVLDVTMPGLDGEQLARLLPGVSIVFYSGIDPADLEALAARTPFARFVSKPAEVPELTNAVRAAVGDRRAKSTMRMRAQRPEPGRYSLHFGRIKP